MAVPVGRRRRRVLVVVVAAVVVATGAVTAAWALSGPDDVASIAGHPVSAAEVAFHLRLLRPTVQNQIQVQRGTTAERLDWDAEVDGTTARRVLEGRVLDEIAQDKTVFIVAHELGLVDYVDFSGFESALADENASRARDLAGGEIVFGLTSFTPAEYYSHTVTDLRTRMQTALSEDVSDPLYVTDRELTDYYRAHAGDWAANATRYKLTRLTVPVTGDREAVRTDLAAKLQGTPDLTAVAAGYPGSAVQVRTLDAADATRPTVPDQEALQQVAGLATGQVTAPLDDGGSLVVWRVDVKTVDDARALSLYASRIRAAVVAEKFDAYLAQRVSDSDIVVDYSQMDRIEREGTDK